MKSPAHTITSAASEKLVIVGKLAEAVESERLMASPPPSLSVSDGSSAEEADSELCTRSKARLITLDPRPFRSDPAGPSVMKERLLAMRA